MTSSASNPVATAANAAWWTLNLPSWLAFRSALRDPQRVQEGILRRYLQQNAATCFGRRHGFSSIDSVAAFRRRVPLSDYDALAPDIERIAAGEPNVLTTEPVRRLATSSGSTRAQKLIPYTRRLQREFNRALGPWITELYRRDPSLARGCAYWSITPIAQREDAPSEAGRNAPPIGFEEDSSYLGGFAKHLVDAVMAVPGDIRHVQEIEAFRYSTLRLLLGRADLRLISVWHPSFLELLLNAVEPHWDRLLDDLERGTLSPPVQLEGSQQQKLARGLRPARDRADRLRAAGAGNWPEIWPKLRLISCWADAHAGPAAASLHRRLPHVPLQPKGLLATEAFITIPFADQFPLAVRSHYFELLTDNGRCLGCHELQPDGEYSLVVTTAGGLWRYRLGDRVRVAGFTGQTPSLRLVGRQDQVVDHFGEKLSEGFVGPLLRRTLAELGIGAELAMLAPETGGEAGPHYTLFIATSSATEALQSLADRLEQGLRANPHYAYCRTLGQLAPVCLFHINGSAFSTYAAVLQASGQRLGDLKPTALSARTDWSKHFCGFYLSCA